MPEANLLSICATSFLAVFLLLTVLAGVMRLILVVFPQKEAETDPALLGAIASVYNSIYPGTKVTKVEEIR